MPTPTKPTPSKLTPTKPAVGNKAAPAANGAAAPTEDASEAVKKLEIKTKAVNMNNVARVANSHLSASDDKLHPLMSLKTGNKIERFPATPKDINKLSLTIIDAILLALDADRTGKEDEKKEKLRLQIGLRPSPA